MAEVLDVGRFTALDMLGTTGTLRRRRSVGAEFVLACFALLLLALALLITGQLLFGSAALGLAVNYLPLAAYSILPPPPGRLEDALADVGDVRAEMTRTGLAQVLLLVPFLVGAAAAAQVVKRRAG